MNLQINIEVSSNIFNEPEISKRVSLLFSAMDHVFRRKVDEIFSFLHLVRVENGICLDSLYFDSNVIITELAFENILCTFKHKFLEAIASYAVTMAFEAHSYNIFDKLMSMLEVTTTFVQAMNGSVMFDTFFEIINSIPNTADYSQIVSELKFHLQENKEKICK